MCDRCKPGGRNQHPLAVVDFNGARIRSALRAPIHRPECVRHLRGPLSRSLICPLCFPTCPTTILWAVVFIYVNPVQRHFLWTRPHPFQPIREPVWSKPALFNANTAPPIVLEVVNTGI